MYYIMSDAEKCLYKSFFESERSEAVYKKQVQKMCLMSE